MRKIILFVILFFSVLFCNADKVADFQKIYIDASRAIDEEMTRISQGGELAPMNGDLQIAIESKWMLDSFFEAEKLDNNKDSATPADYMRVGRMMIATELCHPEHRYILEKAAEYGEPIVCSRLAVGDFVDGNEESAIVRLETAVKKFDSGNVYLPVYFNLAALYGTKALRKNNQRAKEDARMARFYGDLFIKYALETTGPLKVIAYNRDLCIGNGPWSSVLRGKEPEDVLRIRDMYYYFECAGI